MTGHEGREIVLGIRPEAITDREGADPDSNSIHVIEVTEPVGSDTFVVTQMGGKDLVGRFRADVPLKAGERFPFAINMPKAVAFDPTSEQRIA